VGSERGCLVIEIGGEPPVAIRRDGVRDLVFQRGALLLATRDGIYEASADGEVRVVPLGPSAALRDVRELDALGDHAAVATAGGLHLRAAGRAWSRAPLPAGAVERIAFHRDAGGPRLAAWGPGGLWSIAIDASPRAERRTPPRLSEAAVPLALSRTPEGGLLIVYADALARELPDGAWQLLRPSLPPGAELRRHAHAFGHHWLASDAGLLVALRLEGPWQRARGPLGTRSIVTLVGEGAALYVATEREVYAASAEDGAKAPPLPVGGPGVAEVQRAALRHQSLEARDVPELRRGLAKRGWLPELSVAGGYERSRSRGGDYDESVVSGAKRLLHDRDYDRDRELHVALTLRWDLGDLAYHPESVDLSREARALVALRDDVLDEVNQLYFDRLRALAQLSVLPSGAAERHALEARIAELAAGLDAWTGGWWSRALMQSFPGPVTPRRQSR
jgi:hypothetical protein